ncbi:HAD hydrolase-like protein [Undibacterium arcticum]
MAIGDSSNDAQAARAAGCKVLNVPYGYNHGQSIQEVDSDGIVDTLLDAAALISIDNCAS